MTALSCQTNAAARTAPRPLGGDTHAAAAGARRWWRTAAVLALLAPLGAGAQAPGASAPRPAAVKASAASGDVEARYQRERAACLSGQTSQDRSTCLQEAAAARDDAVQRGATAPPSDPDTLRANALRRCEVFPTPEERERCARMAGGEGSRSGSTAEGAVVKELRTREGAPPPPAR